MGTSSPDLAIVATTTPTHACAPFHACQVTRNYGATERFWCSMVYKRHSDTDDAELGEQRHETCMQIRVFSYEYSVTSIYLQLYNYEYTVTSMRTIHYPSKFT